jgi:hypothetical protein
VSATNHLQLFSPLAPLRPLEPVELVDSGELLPMLVDLMGAEATEKMFGFHNGSVGFF